MRMDIKKIVIVFIVIVAILAYVIITGYCFGISLKTTGNVDLKEALIYIANILSGLIGGIVASLFGVELPTDGKISRRQLKTGSLGNFILSVRKTRIDETSKSKEIVGAIYVIAYVLIGIAAIVIWVIDDVPHAFVKNIATISIGLFVVIVKNYFDIE